MDVAKKVRRFVVSRATDTFEKMMRRQAAVEATYVQQDQQPRRQRQQHQSTQTLSQQHQGTQATSPVGVDCGGNSAEHWIESETRQRRGMELALQRMRRQHQQQLQQRQQQQQQQQHQQQQQGLPPAHPSRSPEAPPPTYEEVCTEDQEEVPPPSYESLKL